MNNRFARLIKSGEIATVSDLKSEFKALAKLTHPDLLGPGAAGDDFVHLRAEYEAALRDFVKHRFGSGGPRAGDVFDRRDFYAALLALFKRGFPKEPRHEKERQRYDYCKYLVRAQLAAWDSGYPDLLDEFEYDLIARKRSSPRGYEAALAIALGIFEYHAAGTAIIRTSVGLEFSLLASGVDVGGAAGLAAGYSDGTLGFLGLLVKDMERGPALI
jgi:hypothetical protein